MAEKIVLLNGSPSAYTRLNGIRDYIRAGLRGHGYEPELINIRELPAGDLMHARQSPPITGALRKVEEGDTIIILTPVYKASYSGLLKTFLDLLPQNGLSGKQVLPLAMGGTFGHLLALDYALKPVLASLGTTCIEKGVFILDQQVKKKDGFYELDRQAADRLNAALKTAFPQISIPLYS